MTNQETKEFFQRELEYVKPFREQYKGAKKLCEACENAINALEQQPSDDCVSRAEALSGIRNLYPGTPFVRLNLKKWQEENKKYFECEEIIKALPPVTFTHGTCKDCKYAEIHNGKLSEHCSVKCEPFCRKFLRFTSGEDFYCIDFERRE